MNKYICLSAILIAIFACSACSGSDTVYAPASVKVSSTHILLNDDNAYELSYYASHDWEISVPEDTENQWYEISPMSGKAGNGKISIHASANDSYDDRDILFTIKSEEAEQSVSVSQPMGCGVTDIRIPDETFRAFCLEKFDSNKDGLLSAREVSIVKYLTINYYYHESFNSLEGIQYFKSLKSLIYQSAYDLNELDLSKNQKLEELVLYNSELEELDLSNNRELNHLNLRYNNKLKTLNTSENTKLEYLMLYDHKNLSSVDISNNGSLAKLECNNNNSLENLILGNHPKLLEIDCRYNKQLTSLNLEGCASLQYLYCPNNKLTSLDLHKNSALENIYCSYNQFAILDLTNNLSLKRIMFYYWESNPEIWLNKALENRTDIYIDSYFDTAILYK